MYHWQQTKNHPIESWTYANAAARTGATGFVPADIGRISYQTDTGQYWRLMDDSPVVWQVVYGTVGSGYLEGWTYANAAARTGATGFLPADVGRVAYQTDTGDYWRLTDDSPVLWQKIDGHLESFIYADAGARASATGFQASDVGRVAYQIDTGQYWRLTATTPTWQLIGPQTPVLGTQSARVRRTTNQSIPSSTTTALSFDAERWDTDNIWSVGNPTRLTCNTAGKYQIVGYVRFQSAAVTGASRIASIRLNGTTELAHFNKSPGVSGENIEVTVTAQWDMAVNDYVELTIFQDNGTAINIEVQAAWSPEFSMTRLAETGATGPIGPQGPPGAGAGGLMEKWTYANALARTTAIGFSPGDVGTVAYQTDTGEYWRLADDSPVFWQKINGQLESFIYANATARTGATGFSASDIGRIAYQSDTGEYFRLTATTPTWGSTTQLGTGYVNGLTNVVSGTTSTTGLMCGLGTGATPALITPVQSGKVSVIIFCNIRNTIAASANNFQIRYGTIPAPANGAALTGTQVGASIQSTTTAANNNYGFSIGTILPGLTLGTQYWVDLQQAATTGGGTVSMANVMISMFELP